MKKNNTLYITFFFIFISFGCSEHKSEYIVNYCEKSPIIDGQVDMLWNKASKAEIIGSIVGDLMRESQNDFNGYFKCIQNKTDLFFLIEVIDDENKTYNDSIVNYWEQDNVELFFTNASRKVDLDQMTLSDSIYYLCFSYGKERVIRINTNTLDLESKQRKTDSSYIIEARIPIIERTLTNKREIGFNIELTDNDNKSQDEGYIQGRETSLCWTKNGIRKSWQETIHYGSLILK